MALPIRFWNSWTSCVPSAIDGGQRIVGDHGPALLDGELAGSATPASSDRGAIRGLELAAPGADAGVGQQVVDQLLHPGGARRPR